MSVTRRAKLRPEDLPDGAQIYVTEKLEGVEYLFHFVRTYWFRTPEGRPLFAKIRYETKVPHLHAKTFRYGWMDETRWRREKPNPSKRRGAVDADAWLFGLETLRKGDSVYWTEGEKDCETLWALGLAAVSHHGGAGKVFEEMFQHLVGHKVIIVGDNDTPGHYDATLRVEGCREAGIHHVIRFPEASLKDVTDHVEKFGDIERLERMGPKRLAKLAELFNESVGREHGYEGEKD
jgi:hypothetical protein